MIDDLQGVLCVWIESQRGQIIIVIIYRSMSTLLHPTLLAPFKFEFLPLAGGIELWVNRSSRNEILPGFETTRMVAWPQNRYLGNIDVLVNAFRSDFLLIKARPEFFAYLRVDLPNLFWHIFSRRKQVLFFVNVSALFRQMIINSTVFVLTRRG